MDLSKLHLNSVLFLPEVALWAFLALFLYFRAGRRELFKRDTLFDFAFWTIVGGFLGGRIFDFVLRPNYYGWLFKKLLFFNAYGGFNVWGALVSGVFAGYFFLKLAKVEKPWLIFDICASPVAFGTSLVCLSLFFLKSEIIYLIIALVAFLIFLVLKRLEKIKRHSGFFICFIIVAIAIANALLYPLKTHENYIFGVGQDLIVPMMLVTVFSVIWYKLSKRKIKADLKILIAILLLVVMRVKRVLTSLSEANNFAKSIIMIPVSTLKLVTFLVLLTGREIYASLIDFKKAIGIK